MAWFLSTRASVATFLSTHPCVSSCVWVNALTWKTSSVHDIFKLVIVQEHVSNFESNVSFLWIQLGTISKTDQRHQIPRPHRRTIWLYGGNGPCYDGTYGIHSSWKYCKDYTMPHKYEFVVISRNACFFSYISTLRWQPLWHAWVANGI